MIGSGTEFSGTDSESILARLRDLGPIRRVNNGRTNVIGRFPSSKTGRAVQYESMLEFAYVVWREWDPEVLEFYDQPLQIPLVGGGSPASRPRWHVPDFLVVRPDRIALEEVKPKARLQQNPHLQNRSEQARAWAEARGLAYVVVTEDYLPAPPILGNLMFLATFRVPPTSLVQYEPELLERVAETPGLTVTELVRAVSTDPHAVLPCVWHLLFTHRLATDLAREPFRPGSESRIRLALAAPRG
jgi:TnsA endonuclease N terminal